MHELNRRDFGRRNDARFFLWATLAALALRLLLVFRFPAVVDDSRLYADIAKNWLQHGIYGITNSGVIMPTLSRLAGVSRLSRGDLRALRSRTISAPSCSCKSLFDLATCFLIADMARRLFSASAPRGRLSSGCACPFLANYAAAALTETLEIFFTALAFDLRVPGLGGRRTCASAIR